MKEKLVSLYNDKKNLIINGNISSGKTTNILFPLVEKMIENKESMFLLDSKEEYIGKYYETLKNNDYNIITINLRDPLNSEGWNPFLYPYKLYKNGKIDEALDFLDKISESIFFDKNSSDPFWINSARDIFIACVLGLFDDANIDEINLNSVASLLDNFKTKIGNTTYSTEYFNLKDPCSAVYRYARGVVSAPIETRGGILSVANQKINMYVSRENLSLMLSKTTFDFENLGSKPTAIIFINHDEKSGYSRVVNMFIGQLYSMLINDGNSKFNFILDNFDTLDSFSDLKNILSSCIARNIKVFLATRSLERLEDDYTFYIEKLANVMNINKNTIDLLIDDEIISLNNEFEKVLIDKPNISYPIFEKMPINIFSVVDYIKEKKRKVISKDLINDGDVKIEDLIKKIDEKIAELEKKEV